MCAGRRLSVLSPSLLSVTGWECVGLIQLESLAQLCLKDFIMMVPTALWPVSKGAYCGLLECLVCL